MKTLAQALFALALAAAGTVQANWFEEFKDSASDDELYRFVTAMPKGGDLHNHITGSVHSEWFWELALGAQAQGYRYYTKVRINNCRLDSNEFGGEPYLILFKTLQQSDVEALSECEQGEYEPVEELTGDLKQQWLDAMRLDQPHEGRDEFFEALWPRVDGMLNNPHLNAELVVMNMKAFGAEGLSYIEAQIPVHGMRDPQGNPIDPDTVADIYRARLAEKDAIDTGVTVRFQLAILRFHPMAEEFLRVVYQFVHANDDWVGVNMVGREDNDKGYPLRFLPTLRELRRDVGDVPLAIHAGEVDEPSENVRDTLLLGADRIGHGLNLITDNDTMLLMRHGPYLVEINLVSNLLLEYVSDYSEHPFPEYLRTDIPVALSTDDRGMWDSTISDEFFIAIKEFDLTWDELLKLHRNSIRYAFVEEPVKTSLMENLNRRLATFERRFKRGGLKAVAVEPQYRGFLCRQYDVCQPDNN